MISGFLKIIIILLVFVAYHNDRSKKKEKKIGKEKDLQKSQNDIYFNFQTLFILYVWRLF